MATGFSPQQIASIARAQVAAALNPQVQAIQNQGKLTDQQLTQQAQNAQDAYNVVAELMKNLSAQVQAPYTAAAQTQASLGKGFSQQFNQNMQANTDQANQLLAQNNAPSRLSAPTGQADVIYALGGYDPASVLNAHGAALAAAAANRPDNTRLMGAQAYTAGLGKVAQNDLKTSADVTKLLATAPGLQQTAVDRINSQLLAQQRLDLAGQKVNPTLSASMGVLVNDQGQMLTGKNGKPVPYTPYQKPGVGTIVKGADGYYRVAPDGTITNLGIAPPKTSGSGQFVHSGANVYRINPDGTLTQVIAAPPPKSQDGKQGGFTPKQISDFKKVAAATAADLWEGVANFDKKSGKFTGWVQQPLTYQQALQYMTDRGIPMWIAQLSLKRYWTKPGMDMAPDARAALTQAGKPIVPAWAKSDTGPIYARGQGTKVYKAGKVLAAQGAATNDPLAQKVIGLAVQALGTPYVWGGSRPGGFDCSGLLYYVWGQAGVQIPRTTYDQWSAGQAVPLNQLQPGDAVFFKGSDSRTTSTGQLLPGHVAMYVGDGKIIEAYGRGVPVRVTTLAGRNDLMGARRFG